MATCTDCHEEVDADAAVCPHCGYSPRDDLDKLAKRRMLIGGVTFWTGIGLVYFLMGVRNMFQARNATVAE